MKYYDGKKIKEYIRTHSEGLCAVGIGMCEDWSWTAEEVWRGGKFRKNLNRRFIKVSGISGSYWATPTLCAIFAEDIQRMKQFAHATAFDGSLEQEC